MSRKRRSKRHMKRYSKHSKTHIRRNMYRKKHKKTQRGGGALKHEYIKTTDRHIPAKVDIPIPHGVAWYIQDKVYRPEPVKEHMPIQDKDDVPADFLPPRWKKVGGEDGKEYVVEPDCSYIHPSESKDLKKILEYNYEKLMLEKHSKLSPAPSESPKLPTLHESPKSSTSHESPKSPKSPKSSKSSKSSKSK